MYIYNSLVNQHQMNPLVMVWDVYSCYQYGKVVVCLPFGGTADCGRSATLRCAVGFCRASAATSGISPRLHKQHVSQGSVQLLVPVTISRGLHGQTLHTAGQCCNLWHAIQRPCFVARPGVSQPAGTLKL